jgi:16S rRNA processing protein RimM
LSHPAGWLRAGGVGSPHGLDGSFHVVNPNPDLLGLGASVVIGDRELRIARRAGTDRRLIVRLEGCEDRSAAQALRGEEMLAARDGTAPLGPEEWWAEDLEGCTVHDRGRPVGTVKKLTALPSCEMLEVVRAEGGPDLLVPLVRDAVRAVDVERREIDVDLRFLGEG